MIYYVTIYNSILLFRISIFKKIDLMTPPIGINIYGKKDFSFIRFGQMYTNYLQLKFVYLYHSYVLFKNQYTIYI